MSKTIYKYLVPEGEGLLPGAVEVPTDATFVSLGQDSSGRDNALYLMVDPNSPRERVFFARVNTGHALPDAETLFPLTTTKNDTHIRHLFLVRNPAVEPQDNPWFTADPVDEPEAPEDFDGTFYVNLYGGACVNILDGEGDSAAKPDQPGTYRLIVAN